MSNVTEAILSCQASKWHSAFQDLCYQRRFIELPDDFVEFLVSDRVFVQGKTKLFGDSAELEYPSSSDTDVSCNDAVDPEVEFPETMKQIQGRLPSDEILSRTTADQIDDLGGIVVPKLNWSAPTDVIWLSPDRKLKCSSAEEVVLFLKSSDRVAHDICSAFESLSPPPSVKHVLCLTKYFDLLPQSEFRCFVRHGRLMGISQRDITQFYPQLAGEEDRIRQLLCQWFEQHIQSNFALPQYSFDVYITRKERIKLLDFNAVCPFSSPLLFSWQELGLDADNPTPTDALSQGDSEVPVRFVKDDGSIMLGPTMAVSMPYDMVGCSLTEALEKMQQASLEQN